MTSEKYLSVPSVVVPGFALRPISTADLDSWYAYLRIPEVIEHTSWNLSGSGDLAELIRWYTSEEPGTAIRLALIDVPNDKLIGTFGFHSISVPHRTTELAFDLHPSFWGRGLAGATCRCVVDWGFVVKQFLRIQATTLDTNTRSQRLLRRCGFELEGTLRNYRLVRGRPGNFLMYSILPPAGAVK